MRVAYVECFSGISGDMFLGALLDVGVSEELLHKTNASLDIGTELRISRVDRTGVSATKVDVLVKGALEQLSEHEHAHQECHSHPHEYAPTHDHHHAHGRSLSTIRETICQADIPEPARETAIRAFELLGAAETGIHGVPIESIHFHEVGAIDSIADIVCTAVGCHALGVDAFICSPLNVGGGTITCAHGEFPVPAPATLELLQGAPLYSSGAKAELVTPTGAALIRALNCRFSDFPRMQVQRVGYGAGSRNPPGNPNVLRISVGELLEIQQLAKSSGDDFKTITVLETTIDDLTPQVMGYVTERLLGAGALEVFVISAQMKKNRPGSLLTVLCRNETDRRMREIIFSETSTLGIRMRQERRDCLERKSVPVTTHWGTVRVKESSLNGLVSNYSPEYDDCRRIAEQQGVPLKQVQQETINTYLALRTPGRKPQVA